MKKKIIPILSMMCLVVCMLAISAGAVSTTGNIDYDEMATLVDGTVLPIYDEDRNPLIWYISGTETAVNEAGEEITKNIYSSVVSTATKENPDKNGYYVVYNGTNPTFTGPTGEKLTYHYSQSIYIKSVNDAAVNVLCKDKMVVANMRGTKIGDFQGGTINALQYLYAPECMVRSGDLRNSKSLKVADYTQSTSLRELLTEIIKTRSTEIRFPTIEPVYDENGVLINAFTIGSFCFQGSGRTAIEFPETLYKVDKNAFQNCKQLTSIGYTPNLTIIGNDAFESCYVLTGLDFASTSLETIGARAFRYAGLQDNIVFPSTLTTIGDNAFYQAKLIKAVTLSENLTSVGAQTFRQITTLEYFNFNNCDVTSISDYFFWKDSALKAVVFPEGFESFGVRPFEGCSALEVIYFPDSVNALPFLQGAKNLYFVNEPFAIEWESGIFSSADWNGQKPQKPEIYYMPESLTAVQETGLHSCTGINNTVVFPKGFTAVTHEYTFFAIADKNFVFLGEVTLLNVNSNAKSSYYFMNDSVTADSLTVQGNGNHNIYFHSEGVHFGEKTVTGTEATCVTNEFATKICFCGDEMGVFELEGTALGHNHTVYVGMTYVDYFAPGFFGTRCERCDDVCGEGSIDPIFTWVGYSCTEFAIGGAYSITQGYNVNRVALDAYMLEKGEDFSFGVVAAVNKTDDAVMPSLNSQFAFEFTNLMHDAFDIRVTGLGEGNLATNVILCAYVLDCGKTLYLDNGVTVNQLKGFSYNEILAMGK